MPVAQLVEVASRSFITETRPQENRNKGNETAGQSLAAALTSGDSKQGKAPGIRA